MKQETTPAPDVGRLIERAQLFAERLTLSGWRALPCRTCDREGTIGTHALFETLTKLGQEVAAVHASETVLRQERDYFKREWDKMVEAEAACCPEDVGASEYIKALTKRAEAAEARANKNAVDWDDKDVELQRTQEQLEALRQEHARLTERIEKAFKEGFTAGSYMAGALSAQEAWEQSGTKAIAHASVPSSAPTGE